MTFNFSFLHGGFVCPSYLVDLLLLQVSERTNCSTPYERHLITLFSSKAALNVLKDHILTGLVFNHKLTS